MKNIDTDIVIIGAGSVGLPCAYYMAKAGAKVTVIEKLPSAGRGQNRAAIGGIRATHSDPAKITICRKSLDLIKNLKNDTGQDVLWKQGGYLYPVYTEKDEKTLKALLNIQHSYDLNISWITADAIAKLVPGINIKNCRGGTWSPEDGSASPINTADAYFYLARQAGVQFYFNQKIQAIHVDNHRINRVETNDYLFSADLILNCSGAGSRDMGRLTGHDLPVYPESHEAGITEPVQDLFDPMIVDMRPLDGSANYYFYQNSEGQIVFCITPDPHISGQDCDNTSSFLPQVIERMIDIYPRLRHIRVRRTWRGLYPMTPDGFPIVGFTEDICNYYLATGMCGQGYMLGPGLGWILAEKLVKKSTEYDTILDTLSLYRDFKGEEALK